MSRHGFRREAEEYMAFAAMKALNRSEITDAEVPTHPELQRLPAELADHAEREFPDATWQERDDLWASGKLDDRLKGRVVPPPGTN
jgi:hypothetical protein